MAHVYDAICQRRTVRRFTQKVIPFSVLEKLVNCARLAPSGANIQPCEYIVVDNTDLVQKIFPCLRWAGYIAPAGNPPDGERPTAYIVVLVDLHRKKKGGEVDAAAAIQNILLCAWEEKIGTCWLGSIERKQISRLLGIPHHYRLDSVVALGYPNEQPIIEDATGSIKYWKDGQGVLHVPKRPLEHVIHRNTFGE